MEGEKKEQDFFQINRSVFNFQFHYQTVLSLNLLSFKAGSDNDSPIGVLWRLSEEMQVQ